MTKKRCLNVCRIHKTNFSSVLSCVSVPQVPYPPNVLAVFFTKGCSWLGVSLLTTMSLACDTLRKATHHIPGNLWLSQIHQVKEATESSGPIFLSGHQLTPPSPKCKRRDHMQHRPASLFFSINQNITIMVFIAERGEGSLCLGFCSRNQTK